LDDGVGGLFEQADLAVKSTPWTRAGESIRRAVNLSTVLGIL